MKNKQIIISGIIFFALVFVLMAIFSPPDKAKPKKPLPIKGKIAIVLDDWGYHQDTISLAKQIKYPLTCAVLPNLKFSSDVARQLKSFSFEIILHLPMEPKTNVRLEKDTLATGMSDEQAKAIIDKALGSVIFAKGISNHMGSRATEDIRIINRVCLEAKKRKLYFLDSFVTPKSVCANIARVTGTRFAKRDIFLDNNEDPEYIRGQIIKLKTLAAKQGKAIGIGHDRKNTLIVLREMLPRLKKEGYKLVFVSELAQ